VTVEKGVARVKIYGAEGKFESVVAQPTDFAVADNEVLADVAVDSQDRILILDPASKDIRIYEPISADADKSSP